MITATKALNEISIFIFRRDHRLDDNVGLQHCLRLSKLVVPCFIFDIKQIDPKVNDYFSNNQVQFMIESLKDLNESLKKKNSRLHFFHGEIGKTIQTMITEIKPNAIFVNRDVTPYSKARDKLIEECCKRNNLKFCAFDDVTLLDVGKVVLSNGKFYQKFTPYYNAATQYNVPAPEENKYTNYISGDGKYASEFPETKLDSFYQVNSDKVVTGGRTEALKILQSIKDFKNYSDTRNYPIQNTTKLSAYMKFGCVSPREVYKAVADAFGKDCDLIKQLFWRDFYQNVTYFYPHVIGGPMKVKYANIPWENDLKLFEKWKKGETGCPIVDAGMRELNKFGFMPNRVRMIVSNFLVKDLLIDWRWGEKYFAQKLTDYDVSNNNGGWQWSAGCGVDSQPYFRIFNPALQSEKFDKGCEYILKWIPELKTVPKSDIHDWENSYKNHKGVNYPAPCVIHAKQKKKCLDMFSRGFASNTPGTSYLTAMNESKEEEKDVRDSDDGLEASEEEVKISSKRSKRANTGKKKVAAKKKETKVKPASGKTKANSFELEDEETQSSPPKSSFRRRKAPSTAENDVYDREDTKLISKSGKRVKKVA